MQHPMGIQLYAPLVKSKAMLNIWVPSSGGGRRRRKKREGAEGEGGEEGEEEDEEEAAARASKEDEPDAATFWATIDQQYCDPSEQGAPLPGRPLPPAARARTLQAPMIARCRPRQKRFPVCAPRAPRVASEHTLPALRVGAQVGRPGALL